MPKEVPIRTLVSQERVLVDALEERTGPPLLRQIGEEAHHFSTVRGRKMGRAVKTLVGLALLVPAARVGVNMAVPEKIPVPAMVAEYVDTMTNALEGPLDLENPNLRDLLGQGLIALEAALIAGAVVTGGMQLVQRRLSNEQKRQEIESLRREFERRMKDGELSVNMPNGFVALGLVHHDRIHHRDILEKFVGNDLGWGSKALPFCETDENSSGFDVWIKVPDPDSDVSEHGFVDAMDRGDFQKASGIVYFPAGDGHLFLPEPSDRSQFNLSLTEIIERVELIDRYCRDKGIDSKKVVLVCDKSLSHSVQDYSEDNTEKGKLTITLEEEVEKLNPKLEKVEIHIVDPTDLVFQEIMRRNPDGLPLQFFGESQDINALGARFRQKCEELGLRLAKEEDGHDVVRVGYRVDDLAAAGVLPHANSILVDDDMGRRLEFDHGRYSAIEMEDLVSAKIRSIMMISKE